MPAETYLRILSSGSLSRGEPLHVTFARCILESAEMLKVKASRSANTRKAQLKPK